MPNHARCKMTVKNATKPRYNKQNVIMQLVADDVDDEEALATHTTPRGTFTFEVTNPEMMAFFERGKEFYVEFVPADEVEDETPEEPEEDDEETPEGIPPVPDVSVNDLAEHVAGVDNPAHLEAWIEADDRTTATPVYEARLAELEADE